MVLGSFKLLKKRYRLDGFCSCSAGRGNLLALSLALGGKVVLVGSSHRWPGPQ